MSHFTFNKDEETALKNQNFIFRGAQHNGKLFERKNKEDQIEGRILTPSGRIMKVKPAMLSQQSKVIQKFWGNAPAYG